MKASKIKSVTPNGTYDSNYGTLYKFEYEMEDGVILTANHKEASNAFNIGDEVEYEIKGENDFGKWGKVSKPQTNGTPVKGFQKDQEAILYQNHLTNVVSHFTANGFEGINVEVKSMSDWCDIVSDVTLALSKRSLRNIEELKKR